MPVTLLILAYSKLEKRNIYTDLLFYAALSALVGFTYYSLVVRRGRLYIETEIGKQYFDFGKFNVVLKTLFFLAIIGSIVLLGRLAILVLRWYELL
jgi:hypothetical protein